jgi:hypothetical protein
MTGTTEIGAGRMSPWRIAGWGFAVALFLLPAIAMQLTSEVVWGPLDFATAAVLIFGTGALFELAVRGSRSGVYRGAMAVALLTAFLLIWVNLAVGFIGDEGNPANLMFAGVLAIGLIGAIAARFRAAGMARAMAATAFAQALVAAIALVAGGLGGNEAHWPAELLIPSAVFTGLWLAAAWLFGKAAQSAA